MPAAAHDQGDGRRALYLTTWDSILSNMQVLMEQTMDRQIEEEQFLVGWEM